MRFKDVYDNIQTSGKVKKVIFFFLIVLVSGLVLELTLNIMVRSSLYRNLSEDNKSQGKLEARISWISLWEFTEGKVRYVRIEGENCFIKDLKYKKISIRNDGFNVNLPILFREDRLVFKSINHTQIQATVREKDFSNYLKLKYPDIKPEIQFFKDKVEILSEVTVYGRNLPVEVSGNLAVAGFNHLRFYPERVQISGQSLPRSLLDFIGTQLPLEFSMLGDWPLQIKSFSLRKGLIQIVFREINL